ncbi:Phosphatidylinositol 3,5-bisphosphate-binding protein [Basidiobolus ranarum]|uniref:Phosphatidylinositol 3,5-bisphosphate-binding protein n=1 Tax=Basidiobolus ranarum TaxID=34480 RepID=A0ABR2X1R4_9FUNG
MNLSRPSPSSSPTDAPNLLYAGFNQDYGCFAVGLKSGFRIYNCDPLKEKMRKEFDDGGLGIVEMLFRCNYLALVGGGKNPKYSPNKVIIWDDLKGKGIIELEFRSEVKNVKLRRDRIVIVLENKVFVYTFSASPQKLQVYETTDNEKGLVALSPGQSSSILAFPGRQPGHVQIIDLNTLVPTTVSTTLSTSPTGQSFPGTILGLSTNHRHSMSSQHSPLNQSSSQPIKFGSPKIGRHPSAASHTATTTSTLTSNVSIIAAHTTILSSLAISFDGSKIATASIKGTLIRVFDSSSGKLLNELRRGFDRAEIYSIAFSHDGARLCVSSDKGTVHIFNLEFDYDSMERTGSNISPYYGVLNIRDQIAHSASTGNRLSSFSFMKDLLPKYFSSEWSFAHFHVATEGRCICGFGSEKNTVIAICADGSCYKFSFDLRKGGECIRESYIKFLKKIEDD